MCSAASEVVGATGNRYSVTFAVLRLNALCKRSRLYRTSAGDLLEELGDYVEGERSYISILKFFQVDITGMFRMTSRVRYFREGVGSSRPNWRWIICFLERPKANTSCKAVVKRLSFS